MSNRVVCQNRKASHEYFLEERFEAGLVLEGPEVKSLREGRANLVDSYAKIKDGEAWLHNMHISPYPHARHVPQEPTRTRKLLLNRRELKRLIGKTQERGYSLIPTKVYFSGNWAKVEIALARGKRKVDKRRTLKEKEIQREMEQAKKKWSH